MNTTPQWLLTSAEPWTRYRALRDLLGRPEDDTEVKAARAALLAHTQVQSLIAQAATWPGRAILRYNDAGLRKRDGNSRRSARHPAAGLSWLASTSLCCNPARFRRILDDPLGQSRNSPVGRCPWRAVVVTSESRFVYEPS